MSKSKTPAALLGLPVDDQDFQEACLGSIVRDPVQFQEFFYPDPSASAKIPIAHYKQYLRYNHVAIYPSQLPLLLWNVGVFPCGRGVGKTLFANSRFHLHMAINYPGHEIGSFASRADHVEKLKRQAVEQIVEHPILGCFLKSTLLDEIHAELEFHNGSKWFFKFPGKQGKQEERAAGLQGSRASGSTGDEAQNLNATHYQTASNWHLNSPNDLAAQAEQGLFKRLTGVPDGKRDTPLYDADIGKDNQEFVRHPDYFAVPHKIVMRWHLPSAGVGYHSREVHRDWLTRSGSNVELRHFTQNSLQDMWALHGKPAHGLFPRDLREGCARHNKSWRSVLVLPEEFIGPTAAIGGFDPNGNLLTPCYSAFDGSLPERLDGPYAFGMDIGKAADTCIVAFRYDHDVWHWEFLLTMRGWREMEHQCFVVDYLTERYGPIFWGMDQSTLGMSIVSPLQSSPLHPYDYRMLIKGFDSSGHYQFESADEIVDEWATKQERMLSETERAMQLISARNTAKPQPYHYWTLQRIALLMQRHAITIPTGEQAPDVHKEMDAITMTRVTNLSGGFHYEIRPQHPHIVDSLKTFVAGLKLWEAQNRMSVRTVSDTANAQAHMSLMMTGLGL